MRHVEYALWQGDLSPTNTVPIGAVLFRSGRRDNPCLAIEQRTSVSTFDLEPDFYHTWLLDLGERYQEKGLLDDAEERFRACEKLFPRKRQLWQHSLSCAILARTAAVTVRLDPELAFVCALMMDFGKIVLLSLIQEVMDKEPDYRVASEETIEEIIEVYHPKIGGGGGQEVESSSRCERGDHLPSHTGGREETQKLRGHLQSQR